MSDICLVPRLRERKGIEFWLDRFIWRRVVASATAALELRRKGLVFARQQIAFLNQEDDNAEPAAWARDSLLYSYP